MTYGMYRFVGAWKVLVLTFLNFESHDLQSLKSPLFWLFSSTDFCITFLDMNGVALYRSPLYTFCVALLFFLACDLAGACTMLLVHM
jgi:hypothetical protein